MFWARVVIRVQVELQKIDRAVGEWTSELGSSCQFGGCSCLLQETPLVVFLDELTGVCQQQVRDFQQRVGHTAGGGR